MSVELRAVDALSSLRDPSRDPSQVTAKSAATVAGVSTAQSQGSPTPTQQEAVDPADVVSAVKQIQQVINNGPNPDIKLDYLSGLSVVEFRSKVSGELVFQLPDTHAVAMARMIKAGSPLSSLAMMDTQA